MSQGIEAGHQEPLIIKFLRKKVICNLSLAENVLKKAKTNTNATTTHENQIEAVSQDSERSTVVKEALEKEVVVVPWEQKRIMTVYAYCFFKSVDIKDPFREAADFNQASPLFLRKLKEISRPQGQISPYTIWVIRHDQKVFPKGERL